MGLDDFVSDRNGSSSTRQSSIAQSDNTQSEQETQSEKEQDPFKVVTDSRGRSKVFMEKEGWEEAKTFIKNQMEVTVGEVMNMDSIKRHDLLHRAILQQTEDERGGFQPVKHCVVCDKEFVFPNSWTFVEIQNEATCPSHEIGQVMNALSAVKSHGE
jgi:hypothetical protein